MNYFENFRQQNQHLFGEDSDYSDTEPDFDPEENEIIFSSSSWYCEMKEISKKKVRKKFWKKNSKKFRKKIFEKKIFSPRNTLKSRLSMKSQKKIFFWVKSAFSF